MHTASQQPHTHHSEPHTVCAPAQTHMQAIQLQRHIRAHLLQAYTLTHSLHMTSHAHTLTPTRAYSHSTHLDTLHPPPPSHTHTRLETLSVPILYIDSHLHKAINGPTCCLLPHKHMNAQHLGSYATLSRTACTHKYTLIPDMHTGVRFPISLH